MSQKATSFMLNKSVCGEVVGQPRNRVTASVATIYFLHTCIYLFYLFFFFHLKFSLCIHPEVKI